MNPILQGVDMKATYENFYATCSWCGRRNTFNRASDWHDLGVVDYKEVDCLYPDCAKRFFVNGDQVNPCYEMLIYDCYDLLEAKHYSYCILNLAQAFEVFFSQYLRVTLLYLPFGQQVEPDLDAYNGLLNPLYERIKAFSFGKMYRLFFHLAVRTRAPQTLQESKLIIDAIDPFSVPPEPSDDELRDQTLIPDAHLRDLFFRLKYCEVPNLRNMVVHKLAYRPTLEEVNKALQETRGILLPLGQALGIQFDEINWYRFAARRRG
ncbi:MAG: hypothetical protein ABSA41_18185 [Terriglobia bacterium]|jgi:hypothetical protein